MLVSVTVRRRSTSEDGAAQGGGGVHVGLFAGAYVRSEVPLALELALGSIAPGRDSGAASAALR
eukprot:CAMPEP_0204166660 /NCGR_PEP_ID=MMETSP0361-20130328/39193_1 /ASSEMBLY_ACC=CAM_ASM_000343 /TAXON_ID=268821 /ORGANISM="Scrippsiella Hangoei, Strain SHTV-5" /LENGTH=63 /DNA_ID=CAMNT_0051123841 /DNA_START=45 /DNA_END=232 /DNA_ORIENTATION=+